MSNLSILESPAGAGTQLYIADNKIKCDWSSTSSDGIKYYAHDGSYCVQRVVQYIGTGAFNTKTTISGIPGIIQAVFITCVDPYTVTIFPIVQFGFWIRYLDEMKVQTTGTPSITFNKVEYTNNSFSWMSTVSAENQLNAEGAKYIINILAYPPT